MKKLLLFCCLGLLGSLLFGCATKQAPSPSHFSELSPAKSAASVTVTNQLNPEMLRPSSELFTLGPGDRIEIEIVGQPTSRALTTVGPDGKIYFNLLPGVDVWGLTLADTRAVLEKQLAKYVAEPQVAVALREVASKHVWVLGRLNRPGIYPLSSSLTLLEALALAGGPARSASQVSTEELADLRHSFVMRQGQLVPVDFYRLLREGDTSQNIFLQPDDFVYVPSALSQEIYVLGAVRIPRMVPYTERMTLVAAMTQASGPATVEWLNVQGFVPGVQPDAYLSHVAIVRGSLAQPQLMVVNYGAIVKGKEADVLLEPGDIVYVPNAPLSTLKRYFNAAVTTFITTVAANEGIRAGGGSVGIGVSVPVH
jgi:polysaccharide export outer membrane protein